MRFVPVMHSWFNIHKEIDVMHHINRLNEKKYIIKSINAEKAFDKIYYSFMIKMNLIKSEKERRQLTLIRNKYRKHTADILMTKN